MLNDLFGMRKQSLFRKNGCLRLFYVFHNFAYVNSYSQTKTVLHTNEIAQHLQNYKSYEVDRDHFRKLLQSYIKFMKKSDLKTACTIFKDC